MKSRISMANAKNTSTDPALYSVRRKFGMAGGSDEIALTEEGRSRAFSVGSQVKRGEPARALELLWSNQGEGFLCVCVSSSARLELTEFGRINQATWSYLRELGLVESILAVSGTHGGGVRLTELGKAAAWRGFEERKRLLARCTIAATGRSA